MNTLSVRSATPADVSVMHELILDLAEYERLRHQVVATEADLARALFGDHAGQRACAEGLIGEVDGVPQGCAIFFTTYSTFVGRPGLWLEDLFVRPGARGRGLGAALLRRLARLAVERGYGRVDWAVLDWNESAIGFYRGLGARVLDDWRICRLEGEALAAQGGRG
jgi:GNAT superfamily N-acetyltransferase